jgi:undecaprenyl-diphosphatase
MTDLMLRLSHHDERALRALVLRRRWWADHVMRALTHMGGAVISISLAVFLVTMSSDGPIQRAGALGAFALALSHGLVQLIKRSVNRARPRLPAGLESLVRSPDRFSFPSGHSAASLSVALPLGLALGGLAGGAVLGLALLVGFSRSYLGVHYPGDVVAGWLLAVVGVLAGGVVGF